MKPSDRYPSYVTCVAEVLSASTQPLTVDTLVDRVGGQRPTGKGARSAVYRALKQLFQAVPVAPSRYGWLSHLLQGNLFRHPLTSDEARRGFLLLDELEHAVFFPQFFQSHRPDARRLKIDLLGGPTFQAEATIERNTWSLRLGQPFVDWIGMQGGQGRDDILIAVRDAVGGAYMLRLQPREAHDEDAIRDRSIQLALTAEEIVASTRRTQKVVPTWELAAMLIGRGLFDDSLPPEDLHVAMHKYSALKLVDGVGYALADDALATDMTGQHAAARAGSSAADDPRVVPAWAYDDADDWEEGNPELAYADGADADDFCPDYELYVESHRDAGLHESPLSHGDFHLLEAELETLVSLEQEFGYLLPDQQARVTELSERLFIDPDTLRGDEDLPDSPDFEEPPFWQN